MMSHKNNETPAQLIFQYATAGLLALFIFAMVMHLWRVKLSIPFFYSWDSVFTSTWIKSVIDTGWFITNPYIGAPNGYNLVDFPMAENAHFIVIKLLSYFSHNYALVMNVFYILTFPCAAVTALFVFKQFGLRYPFALVAAVLFALQPYHFFREADGHLFLATYSFVPLIIWLAISITTNSMGELSKKQKYIQWGIYGLLCLLIGSSGIYYAVFGMFFILLSGVIASVNDNKMAPLLRAFGLTGLIATALILNVIPSIEYHHRYGADEEVADRTPFESELYGLKITQLLLPVTTDRVPIMAHLKDKYNNSAPLVNTENDYASLGAEGSIGFFILLCVLILRTNLSKEMTIISQLNLCAILLATIGGFASLFAYIISPMIRCYSRISIFIAFFSLYALFFVVQKFTEKYAIFKVKNILIVLMLLLGGFGVFNQTGKSFSARLQNEQIVSNFKNDENFVRTIEENMNPGSMIFQLPYVPFPEHSPVVSMVDYEHFRPYLHSHHLKWSYGSLKGRPMAIWQETQSNLPFKQMLNNLSYMGYSGIYIDRNGYADHGAAIEKQLTELLHVTPMVSENNNLSFFDMRGYVDRVKQEEGESLWNAHVSQVNRETVISVDWNKGFYALEKTNDTTWHWGNKKSRLDIVNYNKEPIRLKINLTFLTQDATASDLLLKSKLINQLFKINNAGTHVSTIINIPPGAHSFYFYSNANQVIAPGDARQLYFRIQDFNWEIV